MTDQNVQLNKLKAIGYCRVSTDDQADHGTSLDSQELAIKEYAQSLGFEIVRIFREDYSGRKLNRPEFDVAREMLRKGSANALIVYDPDRLSRHRTHTMMLIDEFVTLDVRFFSAIDHKEWALNDDTEVLLLALKSNLSHSEVSKIKERTTRGRITRAKENRIIAAIPPFGYQIKRITRTTENGRDILIDRQLEENPEEASIVKLAYELYAYQGLSELALRDHLNQNGYRIRGNTFSRSTLHDILTRKTYIGQYQYRGIEQKVPAILDENLWYTAQDRKRHNKKRLRSMKHFDYTFSGRVTCQCCHNRMVGITLNVSRGKGGNSYYKCNTQDPDTYKRTCENKYYYSAPKLDQIITDWIQSILTNPVELKRGLAEYRELLILEHEPALEDLERVRKLLKRDKDKLGRLLDLYLEGGLDKETYFLRKLDLEESIEATETTIDELQSKLAEIESLPDEPEDIGALEDIVLQGFEQGLEKEELKALAEALDIQLTLYYQDGQKWVDGECIIPGKTLTSLLDGPFLSPDKYVYQLPIRKVRMRAILA